MRLGGHKRIEKRSQALLPGSAQGEQEAMPTNEEEVPAVEVRDLSKVYRRLVAVDKVSLIIKRGEVFGLVGPNGAGKSTLVKMLVGLVVPTQGRARIFGKAAGHPETRRHLGYLPERLSFPGFLQARELLDLHGRLAGLYGRELEQRIQDMLARVGLLSREKQHLHTFSKGMLQRLGLAQALMGRPALLILDELMSGLDPLSQRDLRQALHQLKAEGTTILLNSHQLADVERLCDRVALLHHGQIVRMGVLSELFEQNLVLEIEVDHVCQDLIHQLGTCALSIRQVPEDPCRLLVEVEHREQAADIAVLVQRCGVRLYALTPHTPSLEELFFQTLEEVDVDV